MLPSTRSGAHKRLVERNFVSACDAHGFEEGISKGRKRWVQCFLLFLVESIDIFRSVRFEVKLLESVGGENGIPAIESSVQKFFDWDFAEFDLSKLLLKDNRHICDRN